MSKKDIKAENKIKETIKAKKRSKLLAIQRYLGFQGAHDDTLILKNGGMRAILEVSSVNFNLKSDDEQNSIIFSYQRFLNSLNFPVQILIKSRKLDIDNYLESLRLKAKKQHNELLKNQMEEYIEYVARLVEYADIMEKKFYVVVPKNPFRARKKSMWGSFWEKIHPYLKVEQIIAQKKEFREFKHILDERVNVVTTGLENCGLSIKRLNTSELVTIFYQCYNPQLSRTQKVENVKDYSMEENNEDNLVEQDV